MRTFQPQRILCPVDFSQHSVAALKIAAAIAGAFAAEVISIRVVEADPVQAILAAAAEPAPGIGRSSNE